MLIAAGYHFQKFTDGLRTPPTPPTFKVHIYIAGSRRKVVSSEYGVSVFYLRK